MEQFCFPYRPNMWWAIRIITYVRAPYIPENVILFVTACCWFRSNNPLFLRFPIAAAISLIEP